MVNDPWGTCKGQRLLRVTALCCIAPPEKYNFPYRYSIHIQPHLKHWFEMPTGASERLPLVSSESCPRSPLVFWLTLPSPVLTGPTRRELQGEAEEETIQTFSFTTRYIFHAYDLSCIKGRQKWWIR